MPLSDEPFLGEISIFAGNFAPRGWAFCDGQIMSLSQNTALFSLLGTTYGGNGQTTFALPDLRGRVPVGVGSGPGLSPIDLGQNGGTENINVLTSQIPAHTHTLNAVSKNGTTNIPTNAFMAATGTYDKDYTTSSTPSTDMNSVALKTTGGSQALNLLQPYTTLSFIIAIQGIFPPRQ